MNFTHLLIAGLILGTESRSLPPSSFQEELEEMRWNPRANRVDEIGEIFPATESLNYFIDSGSSQAENELKKKSESQSIEKLPIDFGEKRKENQWIGQLKLMLQDINLEVNENPENQREHFAGFTTPRSSRIFQYTNSLKNLADSTQEIDFYYQDDQDDGKHVKSRHEDSSAQFPPLQQETRDLETGNKTVDTNERNRNNESDKAEAEKLDEMLVVFQNQINRMRKNSEKL